MLSPMRALLSTYRMGETIAASMGLAFGSDYLDPTFRTPEEMTSFLNIPVLAAMPQNGKNGKNAKNGVQAKNGNGVTTHVP